MTRLWDWYQVWGVMSEADYPSPYVSGTNGGYETECEYDADKVTFPIVSQGSVDTPQEILDVLQERPLAMATAAGSSFNFYAGGTVYSSDENCAYYLNHAMVIVGYTAGSGDVSEETVETQEMWCRYR